ncbi:MAG: hypothetical protein Q8O55_07435 [Dehalococcoidales bacterium]|nr:hypothetical protein [Dehalococcoidales bacterium]
MAKFAGKIIDENAFRRVPGFKDIVAIKVKCDVDHLCTGCSNPIKSGQAMWFCDGQYLKSGRDGRWHDKCL